MQSQIASAKTEVSGNPWLNSAFNRHAAGIAPEDYEDQVGTEKVYPLNFLELDDCLETSYLGQNQKLVSVDAATPGLHFVDALGNCYWRARGSDIYYTKGKVSVGTPDVSPHGANFIVSKRGSGSGAETVVLDLEYRAEDEELIGAKSIFVFSHLHWSSQIGSVKTGAIGIGAENEWASYTDLAYLGTFGSYGTADGEFDQPKGIDSTPSYIFVVDNGNCRIQKFDFSTYAFVSKAGSAGSANTQLQGPTGMIHHLGKLYICDQGNNRLIVWNAADLSYSTKYGSVGSGINELNQPHSVCTDGTWLYITDQSNNRIMKRLLSSLAYVSQVGTSGSGDDQFSNPGSICTDGEFLYIADYSNKRLQKRRCNDLSFVKKLDLGFNAQAIAFIDGYIYASYIVSGTYGLTKYTTEFDWVSYNDLGATAPAAMMSRDSRLWISFPHEVKRYLRTVGGSGQYFDSFMGFYLGRYGALVEMARINSSGNLYIGKTSGSYKLDVAGSIRADGQLISSQPVGTSPLAVTSTTVVANLNADLLDGYHESSFVRLTAALGDMIYGGVGPAWAALAGNATATRKYLTQTGTGSVSAAPSWETIAIDDLSDVAVVAAATGDLLRFDGSNWVDYPDSNYEASVAAGTSAQYWRGDKSWQALNQAAIAGLTTSDSPAFVTVKCSGLTDGYIPYHVSDATGLANSPIRSTAADIGMGMAPTTGVRLSITATASCEATLGSTLLTNGGFATNDLTGWTAAAGWSAATGAAVHDHTIADTTPLVQSVTLANARHYQVTFTVARTAGTVTLTFGSLVGSYAYSAAGTYAVSFLSTGAAAFNLTFTPTSTFAGSVDGVSVQLITANTTPIAAFRDSAGSDAATLRASYALSNIGLGLSALRSNTTGNYNSAMGGYALYLNTTGNYNSAMGGYALYLNTTGTQNSAMGYAALRSNTTGNYNSAMGYAALYSNTTGNYNSAMGGYALYLNTTGTQNSAMGYAALNANTEGAGNIALGYFAGRYKAATTSDKLFIDDRDRTNESGEQTLGLIYGGLASATASQFLRINANVGIKTHTFGTSADGVLAIATGAAPSTSPADAFQMYSADQAAGNACAHFRTEGGAVVKLYQQAHQADVKANYAAGELDTEAEIIAAVNATNTRINAMLATIENLGLHATS
jgi:hypothetical protein